ncbi:hypothetical protein JCM3770_002070, partial [Rhodotorula araucariae]
LSSATYGCDGDFWPSELVIKIGERVWVWERVAHIAFCSSHFTAGARTSSTEYTYFDSLNDQGFATTRPAQCPSHLPTLSGEDGRTLRVYFRFQGTVAAWKELAPSLEADWLRRTGLYSIPTTAEARSPFPDILCSRLFRKIPRTSYLATYAPIESTYTNIENSLSMKSDSQLVYGLSSTESFGQVLQGTLLQQQMDSVSERPVKRNECPVCMRTCGIKKSHTRTIRCVACSSLAHYNCLALRFARIWLCSECRIGRNGEGFKVTLRPSGKERKELDMLELD